MSNQPMIKDPTIAEDDLERLKQELAETKLALARERESLKMLINQIPDHFYVKDKESRFLIANQVVADILWARNSG